MRRTWADQVKSKHHLTGLLNQMVVVRVIQDVDAAIAVSEQRTNDHHIEIFWRTAYGFGHGRQWATLNALVRDEVTPLGNATATIRLSNTESRVLWGAAAAYELIDQSLRLYFAACGHERPTADRS